MKREKKSQCNSEPVFRDHPIQRPPLFSYVPIVHCTIDFNLCKETTSIKRPPFGGPEVVAN